MPLEWRKGSHAISTDRARLQLDVVHGYLTRSYWATGITRERVERSIESSLCFGVYELGTDRASSSTNATERQVGFARVVTDFATFAWIGDVFVLEEARGRGLAVWLVQTVSEHPELQGLRRWVLATRDAHGLYRKIGFTPLAAPERFMERTLAKPSALPHS